MRQFLAFSVMVFPVFTPQLRGAEVIGFIYSGGVYHSDGVSVRGNATLFDGGTVETGEAGARVQLNNGARIWLAPQSRATMSRLRVQLSAGLGQFQPVAAFSLETRTVRIASAAPGAMVRVALDKTGGTVVEPVKGTIDVTNLRGFPVGRLMEGAAVRFAGEPGDRGVSLSGCLYGKGGQYGLTDAVTNLTVRLNGMGLENEVGNVVVVSGREGPQSEGILSVSVTGVRRIASSQCRGGAPQGAAGLFAVAKAAPAEGQLQGSGPRLSLMIVEGEGAINNIRQRTAREPVVEVQDDNHRPVAGAVVLFALPRGGPGGTFSNGATTLSVTTDAQGRATARGLKPNNIAGQFEIAVSASYAGMTAAITIRQANALAPPGSTASPNAGNASGSGSAGGGAGAAHAGMALGTKIAIIGGIAASSVAGGLAAAGAFGSGTEPAAGSTFGAEPAISR